MDTNSFTNQFPQNNDMETRLWEYIDGISNEAAVIEKLMAENKEWRVKYAELLELQQLIGATELDEPSMRFTKNVMEQIVQHQIAPAAKKYINTKIIWGIAIFFLAVIGSFLIYGFSQINWMAAGNSSSSFGVDFTNVDYSKMFNNSFVNFFMMLNVILGLMLLDRYLNMKRKKVMKKI